MGLRFELIQNQQKETDNCRSSGYVTCYFRVEFFHSNLTKFFLLLTVNLQVMYLEWLVPKSNTTKLL